MTRDRVHAAVSQAFVYSLQNRINYKCMGKSLK